MFVTVVQLSVMRGDDLDSQRINLQSEILNFENIACSGQIRTHPDGELLYQFYPTIISGTSGSAQVIFDVPASATRTFPPINLYGDVHFYSTGIGNRTLFNFRLCVDPDVTH